MKSVLILIKGLIFSIMLLGADAKLHAQDCKNYYYMMNNAEVQITLYDKNNKTSGVQNWKISNVKKTGTGLSSAVSLTFTDEKGGQIAKASGLYKCEGGRLMADMRISMPHDQTKQVKDDEASLDPSYIEYPAAMSEGMKLPDAHLNMKTNTSGISSAVQFDMNDRQITGKEKVTTPAGTWDAFVIKYEAVMKIKMAGIGIPKTMMTTEWFVPGFGIVKTETYSKKGKLEGSSQLTKLKK